MTELQTDICECGYPLKTGMHASDCPNNPDNSAETGRGEEKTELEDVLTEKVFSEFGITEEDEKKYLESVDYSDKHEAVEKVDQVSFRNIRESIRLFIEYFTEKGVLNMSEYSKKEQEVRIRMRSDRGFGSDNNIPWQIGREIEQKITEQIGQPKTIRFSREEIIDKLKNKLKGIKEHNAITYNVKLGSLDKRLKAGRIIPMTEFEKDKRQGMRKVGGEGAQAASDFLGGGSEEGYDDRRDEAEKAMGIYSEVERPIYATMAGGSKEIIEQGGAPQYGEVTFIIKEEVFNRTVFTEGDSMNPQGMIDAIREKGDLSENRGLNHRQLNKQHAEIALAIYNLSRKLEQPYILEPKGQSARDLQYIEAQILDGVSMDDVGEIIIPWEPGMELDAFKEEYPDYADKFKFVGDQDNLT